MLERTRLFFREDVPATIVFGKILPISPRRKAITCTAANIITGPNLDSPFAGIIAGDWLAFQLGDTGGTPASSPLWDYRKVTVATDPNTLTVGGAAFTTVPTNMVAWHVLPVRQGTTDQDGWVDVKRFREVSIAIEATLAAAGAYVVQARQQGTLTGLPVTLTAGASVAMAASGNFGFTIANNPWAAIRLGLSGDAGVDSISANLEGRA